MKIIKYTTELTGNGLPKLVKEKTCNYIEQSLNEPKKIADMLNSVFHLGRKTEEYVYLICMSSQCIPCGIFELSHGTISSSVVQPREIFLKALSCNAASVILAHNHPSNQTNESADDVKCAKRIKDAGDLMGIPLQDFIIVTRDNFSSFKEKGIM